MGRRNGGQFEFFPVVVENAGFVFTATLLLDIHTRIYVGLSYIGISGGVHVSSFTNVAESIANVTATPNDTTCELAPIQSYRLTLGAAAGATLAIDSHTLDPAASTMNPVGYIEMGFLCAVKPTPTHTAVAASNVTAAVDQALTPTSTQITYTGNMCRCLGLMDCPATVQTTTQSITNSTLGTAAPSGINFYWPATLKSTVIKPSPYGEAAFSIPATSGITVSDTPPVPTHSNASSLGKSIEDGIRGLSAHDKLIVEVSVGVSAPLIVVIHVLCLL